MKQDLAARKFRTQNLVATYTLTLRTRHGSFLKVYFRQAIFRSSRIQESNVLNIVQIGSEMKKL